MRTERTTVTLALAGLCTLGVASAAIPVVGTVLLGLLALAALGAVLGVCWAWHATRFRAPEPVHHLAHTARADATRREVA